VGAGPSNSYLGRDDFVRQRGSIQREPIPLHLFGRDRRLERSAVPNIGATGFPADRDYAYFRILFLETLWKRRNPASLLGDWDRSCRDRAFPADKSRIEHQWLFTRWDGSTPVARLQFNEFNLNEYFPSLHMRL
jgi:hypothetical protein